MTGEQPRKEWTAQSDSADADVGQMPRSPVYYHAECGCELKDDKKVKWCPYHVSGLQETIKAREREAGDLRYRVRELERINASQEAMIQNVQENLSRERDELERQRDQWRMNATSLMKVRSDLEKENNALQDAVEHLREQIPDDMSSNATHWCCYHIRWETREGAEV